VRIGTARDRNALRRRVITRRAWARGSLGAPPPWSFSVRVSVPLVFGLTYFFTNQIQAIMADVLRAERWLGLAGLLALADAGRRRVAMASSRREGAIGMSVAHRQDSRLPNNLPTGDASPGVAGGIGHVIVRPRMDDESRAGGME
jgi:hypothetical protein